MPKTKGWRKPTAIPEDTIFRRFERRHASARVSYGITSEADLFIEMMCGQQMLQRGVPHAELLRDYDTIVWWVLNDMYRVLTESRNEQQPEAEARHGV